MTQKTKKVGPTGKFGSRYGLKIRKRYKAIDLLQRASHVCPQCGAKKVKRESTSIFVCGKCGHRFAGGAYIPTTLVGKTVARIVKQGGGKAEVAEEALEHAETLEEQLEEGEVTKEISEELEESEEFEEAAEEEIPEEEPAEEKVAKKKPRKKAVKKEE
ncbi:MAG: 50S ribosomal protein L37Ae [Candidatus Diapherotrites archaeon]|nr:50S ribosomal protein L37Ae [Candidatus Diapherotrites archaeon]